MSSDGELGCLSSCWLVSCRSNRLAIVIFCSRVFHRYIGMVKDILIEEFTPSGQNRLAVVDSWLRNKSKCWSIHELKVVDRNPLSIVGTVFQRNNSADINHTSQVSLDNVLQGQ